MLVVVFFTNEDDASAPPDSDIFDKKKTAQYGPPTSYFRQTRLAVMCGDPAIFPPYGSSKGPLADCQPAPNPDYGGPGKQYDVQRYKDFFALPRVQGGVKDGPMDVMLVGFDAPAWPFEVTLANATTGEECPMLDEQSNPPCLPVLRHSCMNPRNPDFFGDPAVRLNQVIQSVRQSLVLSICSDSYALGMRQIGRRVAAEIGEGGCILDSFPVDDRGEPVIDCPVKDVTLNPDGTETRVELPRCDEAHSVVPCWWVARKPLCEGVSPQGLGWSVDRGSTDGVPNQAPPHTSVLVSCGEH